MPTEISWKITWFPALAADTNRGRRSERKSRSSDGPDCDTRRRFFYRLDLGVQALADRIGDAMIEVSQHVVQMTVDHLCHLLHRLQAAMRRPKVPPLPVPLRPALALIAPQLAQRLLDGPGAGGLQIRLANPAESFRHFLRSVFFSEQPEVLRALQKI